MAYGSAVSASSLTDTYTLTELEELLRNAKTQTALVADKPLFSYPEEYQRFQERHAAHDVARGDYRTYAGKAYLGIDAGSTTTKIVLLSEDHKLLYEFYASNKGQPLDCIQRELSALYADLSPDCQICGSAVTGYGRPDPCRTGRELRHCQNGGTLQGGFVLLSGGGFHHRHRRTGHQVLQIKNLASTASC